MSSQRPSLLRGEAGRDADHERLGTVDAWFAAMSSTNVLVAFYSRTGTTRSVAKAIARSMNADLEEIREPTDRQGILGYGRSLVDAIRRRPARLDDDRHDAGAYGLVLVGSPVWASSVSAPARAYLERNKNRFKRVAFFVTEGGRGAEGAFAQMKRIVGLEPVATLALKARDVERAIKPTSAFAMTLLTGAQAD